MASISSLVISPFQRETLSLSVELMGISTSPLKRGISLVSVIVLKLKREREKEERDRGSK